jgi:hypothetical protein
MDGVIKFESCTRNRKDQQKDSELLLPEPGSAPAASSILIQLTLFVDGEQRDEAAHGQARLIRSQRNIQCLWKECEQGILLRSSSSSKSFWQTAQPTSLVSAAAGLGIPMIASVEAGTVSRYLA